MWQETAFVFAMLLLWQMHHVLIVFCQLWLYLILSYLIIESKCLFFVAARLILTVDGHQHLALFSRGSQGFWETQLQLMLAMSDPIWFEAQPVPEHKVMVSANVMLIKEKHDYRGQQRWKKCFLKVDECNMSNSLPKQGRSAHQKRTDEKKQEASSNSFGHRDSTHPTRCGGWAACNIIWQQCSNWDLFHLLYLLMVMMVIVDVDPDLASLLTAFHLLPLPHLSTAYCTPKTNFKWRFRKL